MIGGILATAAYFYVQREQKNRGIAVFHEYLVQPVPESIRIRQGGTPPMAGFSFADFSYTGLFEQQNFLSSWSKLERPDEKACSTLVKNGSLIEQLVTYHRIETRQNSGKRYRFICIDPGRNVGTFNAYP